MNSPAQTLAAPIQAGLPAEQPADHSGAETDQQLVAIWLHGRPLTTSVAYRRDAATWCEFLGPRGLRGATLLDLQKFVELGARPRTVSAIKSLHAFGHRLGYLRFDVARALRAKPSSTALADRILSEEEVQRLLEASVKPRDRLLLTLLYVTGVRRHEVATLRCGDLVARHDGAGQINVVGKGQKPRSIWLPGSLFAELTARCTNCEASDPVFRSRQESRNGRELSPSMMWRIVKRAARRAGLSNRVSPHWFRHAHASHAIERGASLPLVQSTLGHSSVGTTSRYLHSRPGESSARFLAVSGSRRFSKALGDPSSVEHDTRDEP